MGGGREGRRKKKRMEARLENDGNVCCQCCYLLPCTPSLSLSLSLCIFASLSFSLPLPFLSALRAAKMHNITSLFPMKSAAVISVLPSASKGRSHRRSCGAGARYPTCGATAPLWSRLIIFSFSLRAAARILWSREEARFHLARFPWLRSGSFLRFARLRTRRDLDAGGTKLRFCEKQRPFRRDTRNRGSQ